MQIVPLTSEPNQSIVTTLSVNGNNLSLKLDFNFNEIAGYWVIKISNPKTQNIIVDNIPLLTSDSTDSDILEQYSYLKIGKAAIINVGNSVLDYPDANTLGSDFVLVWLDND